jgi:hypothetical protein
MKTGSVFLGLLLFAIGCGTTAGNPTVILEFAGYNSGSDTPGVLSLFEQTAPLPTIKDLRFCFKRVRFKNEAALEDEDLDFPIGLQMINPEGVRLGAVTPKPGFYDRIEFDLAPKCQDSIAERLPSVAFSKAGRELLTDDRITLRFENQYEVRAGVVISLNVEVLVNALSRVSQGSEIRRALQGAVGR